VDESDAWDRAGQALSRRELRALRGAVEEQELDPGQVETLPSPDGDLTVDDVPAEPPSEPDEQDAAESVPVDAAPGKAPVDPWRQRVDWSLRHELPSELPPEPELDDVRWDGPPVAPAPGTAPTRVPVLRASFAPADPLPADEPWPDVVGEPAVESGPPVAAPQSVPGPPPRPVEPEPGPEPDTVPTSPLRLAGPRPVDGALPTLTDLLAGRPVPPAGPAQHGWQGTLRRVSGGLVALRPGPSEQRHRAAITSVQRSLDGPKTVVVINPKGGAHKTTASLLLAATFGQHRGGYTLAWDNNETRGTLGWRSHQAHHHNTAVNLLQDLDRFADPGSARVGDLDNYVRAQGSAQFDVLASDEDAASAASIDAFAFRSLHRTLSRFYRIMVVDTGNNMRASNWQAAIEAADQVVIVSTVREDTAQSAAWAIDALRATGHADAVRNAVTVLSAPAPRRDDRLAARLHEHFGQLTRAVVDVPYDPSLVGGSPLEIERLARPTREAWLRVTAEVADGLQT